MANKTTQDGRVRNKTHYYANLQCECKIESVKTEVRMHICGIGVKIAKRVQICKIGRGKKMLCKCKYAGLV